VKVMVYGATGFTGRMIVSNLLNKNLEIVLAGRNAQKLQPYQAQGVQVRSFEVEKIPEDALSNVDILLNAAGPFSKTVEPLVQAALKSGIHYLDISGEVPEFNCTLKYHKEATAKNIMLMPGVGFGVVPTDCVDAKLKNAMADATHLQLAFKTIGGASRGTAQSVLTYLPEGGSVRQNGLLQPLATGQGSILVDFGNGLEKALANPWRADLISAFVSTSIQNIQTYSVMPSPLKELISLYPTFGWLFKSAFFQKLLNEQIQKVPEGPDEVSRKQGSSYVWGKVKNQVGKSKIYALKLPDAYEFTAHCAADIVEQVLQGKVKSGFQSPSQVFGADFALKFTGVEELHGGIL
jgi:short subunit dehydrogenase-like uncharacterized protein